MIRIFGQTDKLFVSNGDLVINPLKAKVHKEDNGDYYLNIETGIEYVDYLVEGNIIVVPTPQGDQAFRVSNVIKTKSRLASKCYHVFYDSQNYLIEKSNVVNKSCNDALTQLNGATEPQSEFTVSSDVATVDSYDCVRQSLYEAIQTVLEKWGGHLVRDNFSIQIKASIGQDNGVVVQYKKNLKEISCSENWDNVVTKILPVGKDGIMLNALNSHADIYITSSTQYDIPYTKTVTFDQNDIQQEDYWTESAYITALVNDLRSKATDYLNANCIPQVNYTLKANLERITDVGDIVEVIDDRLNVHLMTNVIGFDYDCIAGSYTEVEFGTFSKTMSGFANTLTSNIEKKTNQAIAEQVSIVNGHSAEMVTNPAKKPYSYGEFVIFNNIFCKVIQPIAQGDDFVIGLDGNLIETTLGDQIKGISTDIVNSIYPVGSIYMSVNSTSPAILFGGTWSQIKDTFLLSCGDTYTAGDTGGEATHKLTSTEMPSHRHSLEYSTDGGSTYTTATLGRTGSTQATKNLAMGDSIASGYTVRVKATGGSVAHNNMPPYLAVYMWQRTA